MSREPKIAVVGGVQWAPCNGYPIVWVEKDGAVRECTATERAYLETEFELDDGGRPYIMHAYRRWVWWRLRHDWGFCPRERIPPDVRIRPAP